MLLHHKVGAKNKGINLHVMMGGGGQSMLEEQWGGKRAHVRASAI